MKISTNMDNAIENMPRLTEENSDGINSDEARESGDGDSGAESKDSYESLNKPLKHILNDTHHQDHKKLKDKKISKIPVRQINKLITTTQIPFQTNSNHMAPLENATGDACTEDVVIINDKCDVGDFRENSNKTCGTGEIGCNSLDVVNAVEDELGVDELVIHEGSPDDRPSVDGIQIDPNLGSNTQENPIPIQSLPNSLHDPPDNITVESRDEVDFPSLGSKVSLAHADLEETILEAPEEFRSMYTKAFGGACDEQVATTAVEAEDPVYHDHDNAPIPETGDTSQLTPDKDENNRGSEQIQNINNEYVQEFSAVCDEDNIEVPQDNAHVQSDCCDTTVTVREQHVGAAAPADDALFVNSDVNCEENVANSDEKIALVTGMSNDGGCVNAADGLKCAYGGDVVNIVGSPVSGVDANVCASQLQSPPTEEASIEIGVAECAQAPGCSRVSTAKVCSALDPERTKSPTSREQIKTHQSTTTPPTPVQCTSPEPPPPNGTTSTGIKCNETNVNNPTEHLCWRFKNGRLVFETAESKSVLDAAASQAPGHKQVVVADAGRTDKLNEDEIKDVLLSRDLNKRIDESRSRLKYLEQKLKDAGITDDTTLESNNKPKTSTEELNCLNTTNKPQTFYDANQNIVEDHEEEDLIPSQESSEFAELPKDFCQFDVRQVETFSGFNGYFEVYDELENDSSGCDEEDHQHIIINNMREDGNMGTDGERTKHNPDRDNLKSLIKSGKNKVKKRVVFNENKNEFFDADYIILIREECDYDDEDDDGICTCNQHEMVRLTCCEPNCNCSVYDGYDQTPQSPKFAPPIEFVDAVTLSPPEGYKDMELGEQQLLALQQIARRGQRAAVCRECSATHEEDEDDDGEGSQSDTEVAGELGQSEGQEEKEKTDQSQQTTPTTPPNDSDSQHCILETITMTTVTEQRILREADKDSGKFLGTSLAAPGSPISSILKNGTLWKQQSLDTNILNPVEPQQTTDSSITSDEENGGGRRSVRFIDADQDKRDSCDGAPDNPTEEDNKPEKNTSELTKPTDNYNNSTSPESTEMTLTFKLGNHVLISNNSLKENSAVRQLFPCTASLTAKDGDDESVQQYKVTAESLRAFEEAKRSKLPQIIQSGETDESIKRAIERNTLRRSLIRYEPRSKKTIQKTDNSLVERIKQLTCDVDDLNQEDIPARVSPPGEEARNSPEVLTINKNHDKSFSPSSSSTASSNSSSMSSTYKKITDLFGKREKLPDIQNNYSCETKQVQTLPDIGGPHNNEISSDENNCAVSKVSAATNESRRQFLSTLAPLTACVSGMGSTDEYYYHMSNQIGERASVASSVGTEYSLDDIDEGLKIGDEDPRRIAPDVLAGTPSASESGDELAMFVQQDASRIERIKQKYQLEHQHKKNDDEHDDYGFNHRPIVCTVPPADPKNSNSDAANSSNHPNLSNPKPPKPAKFGSTTEILQQIQNQIQPPPQTARVAWPYYSESGLTDNSKQRNMNQAALPNYPYPMVPEEAKARGFVPQYRPTSLQDENLYQNCANQRCVREVYRSNANTYSSVFRVAGGCNEYYQSMPRPRNGRPQSPPPLEMKNYHQTMVYIPYNHIENYQPVVSQNPYYQTNDYTRVTNQNQINKRYVEPIYQQRMYASAGHVDEQVYQSNPNMLPPKQMVRVSLPNGQPPHMGNYRSESPLPGQFSTARSTQTPAATMSTCNYYQPNPRYRPMVGPVWQGEGNYVSKINRHSFPAGPRYPSTDNGSLTDSDSQHSGQLPNGFKPASDYPVQKASPTKPRFIERGVPEGAASVSPQDTTNVAVVAQSNGSTMTSPTSPQNPPTSTNPKPLFYAMNV